MSDRSAGILRNLTVSDVPAAMQLSLEAGWNQVEDDWRTLLALAPQGCLGIQVASDLVSTATLFCYGKRLAWIGMVLTRSSHRGRGFARRLMTEALSRADRWGIDTVKLDATEQGQPLYEKLGFRPEQPIERWSREARPAQASALPSTSSPEQWLSADARAFGADRADLLNHLALRSQQFCIGNSYVLTRPGRVSRYLGPCVAEDTDIARTLIEGALRTPSEAWAWDLLPENTNAVALARQFGFTPKRSRR